MNLYKMPKKSKVPTSNKLAQVSNRNVVIIVALVVVVLLATFTGIYFKKNPLDLQALWGGKDVEKQIIEKLRAVEKDSTAQLSNILSSEPIYQDIEEILSNGFYPSDVELFTIEDESFNAEDFNYYLLKLYPELFSSGEKPTDEQLLEVIKEIHRDSVILQEYGNQYSGEPFTLFGDDVMRNPEQYISRNGAILSTSDAFGVRSTGSVQGRGVRLWFRDIYPSEIDPESAEGMAYNRMERYKADLEQKVVDMKDVAEHISRDDISMTLAPSANSSPFYEFNITVEDDYFSNVENGQVISDLKQGSISPILKGFETVDQEKVPSFYTIVQITEKNGDFKTLDASLENILKEYRIKLISK